MTSKDISKVQNVVKKSNESTLTGAVKAWCALFKSQKEVTEILKEAEVNVSKDVVPSLVNLAKDKELVISLCKDILPKVGNTFCGYKVVEVTYNDKNETDKNQKIPNEKITDMAIYGTEHKRFGYNEAVEYSDKANPLPYYEIHNNEEKIIKKVAVPIKRYTYALIAKCVTYYLTHSKNER